MKVNNKSIIGSVEDFVGDLLDIWSKNFDLFSFRFEEFIDILIVKFDTLSL